ncbi:MAG: redoxin domain-containing protein [Phycisphaerales bacterium]|nr:redoxin domain-containing protein [Phycisphaerales bacterium]
MHTPRFAVVSVALLACASGAWGQYGGGYGPPMPAPPAPAHPTTPAAPQFPEEDDEDLDAQPTTPGTPSTPTPGAPAGPSAPKAKSTERFNCSAPEKGWVAKLDQADRAAIDERLGYALPAMSSDLDWVGSTTSAPTLEGKVVVIQTFDVNSGGLGPIDKVASALKALDDEADLVVIGVQVPTKVEASTPRVAKSKAKASLCVDTTGAWCDALGAFRKPVNFVVDKSGTVRFVGLTAKGVLSAVKVLLEEPRRPEGAADRPAATVAADPTASFPTYTGPLSGANDLRGKPSPELLVDQWMSKAPDTRGKLIIVDFFFTGCAPCRAAIPHMNEIADHYKNQVAVVGVSWETKSTYDSGLTRYKLKQSDFHYATGLDSSRRTVGAFGVQSYPNVAVISSDGVVRWQGHPTGLTQAVLDPIVAANLALAPTGGSGSRGWVK